MTHAENLDAITTLAIIRSNLATIFAHVDALSELLEQHSSGELGREPRRYVLPSAVYDHVRIVSEGEVDPAVLR